MALLFSKAFLGCSSAQKMKQDLPFHLGEVYFQKWNAGVKEAGSGTDLYITLISELPKDVRMDSIFFKGKGTKIIMLKDNNHMYVGRFKAEYIQKTDYIMKETSAKEYGNEVPPLSKKIPYELKDSEAVLSYISNEKTKYFKIENITEKATQNYPSAATNKQ